MCLPKKPKGQPTPTGPAAQPTAIPSIQSATNLQLGGDQAGSPRGAAQLGRLMLRFGSGASSSRTGSRSSAQASSGTSGPAAVSGFPSTPIQPASSPAYPMNFPLRGFELASQL